MLRSANIDFASRSTSSERHPSFVRILVLDFSSSTMLGPQNIKLSFAGIWSRRSKRSIIRGLSFLNISKFSSTKLSCAWTSFSSKTFICLSSSRSSSLFKLGTIRLPCDASSLPLTTVFANHSFEISASLSGPMSRI